MRSFLFHAIEPENPSQNWHDFLFDAANLALPEGVEKLAPNVWLLPQNDQTYHRLAQLGHQHGIETRYVVVERSPVWQSPSAPR
jgi:hypothetical protein